MGLHLDHQWSPADGIAKDVHGIVTTYQQVSTKASNGADTAKKLRGLANGTFVILDEVHHAGDERAWGDGVRTAFELANRRLNLSGTPFRSDTASIPFVRYEDRRGWRGAARLHLRLRRCAARRRRRTAGVLPPVRRLDGVERPRRQHHQRQLPRRPRPRRLVAPAASRAQPGGRLAGSGDDPGARPTAADPPQPARCGEALAICMDQDHRATSCASSAIASRSRPTWW